MGGGVEIRLCTAVTYHHSRRRSCKSELPFPFNRGSGFAVAFWWGKVCASRVGACREKDSPKSPLCCGRWAGGYSCRTRLLLDHPDVQCGSVLCSVRATWPANRWSWFEDKDSPGAWGWDLAVFWVWCLLHETHPSLFILLDNCTSRMLTPMSHRTMHMRLHNTDNMHEHSHPQLTLLK